MATPPLLGPDGEPCRACGTPLASDQRYCLACGERRGAPRLDFRELLAPAGPAVAQPEPGPEAAGVADDDWSLPSPRASAALVLATLAFGSLIGTTLRTDPAGAGGRPNLTIVAGPPAPAPTPAAAAPAAQPPAAPDDGGALADSSPSPAPAPTPAPVVQPPADTPPAPAPEPDQPATPAPKVPPVSHVWLVSLTGHSADETFGEASPAPYLAQELRAKGTLLSGYHAVGHGPSTGGVALLGARVVDPGAAAGPYAADVPTLADRLTGAGRTWKAYVEGAADGLAPGDSPCSRPPDSQPRNPFLRFASLTGDPACGSQIATPEALAADLADPEATPSLSYILPGPCHDGTDQPCAEGAPAGLAAADAWLRTVVEPILASKAYAQGGLVVVTFDEGRADDVEGGGGRVGALLLSKYVKAGADVATPFDHFGLLRSIEELFGVDPVGDAIRQDAKRFGRTVYAAWSQDVHASATQRQHAAG